MSQNALNTLLLAAWQFFEEYHGKTFREFVVRVAQSGVLGERKLPGDLTSADREIVCMRYASLISEDSRLLLSVTAHFRSL